MTSHISNDVRNNISSQVDGPQPNVISQNYNEPRSANYNSNQYTQPATSHARRESSSSLSSSSRNINAQSKRIGPYILGKTLGSGSTGIVKLGTHCETGKRVAIKIVPKEPNNQDKNKPQSDVAHNKKLEREITIMQLIKHPNVMELYDVYETKKELYLVLEHVEGGELFDYLVKKGRLSEFEALRFFQQIIFGIDFCHDYGICHRDLKPENLLLDKDLNVKIADFGMASLQVAGKMLETSCGSPHYASPEIIKGIKYDGPTADVWSCGVILYALLTGNLPFDDENIRRLLAKVKAGQYYIPDHVSPMARDLIQKMLTLDPRNRITIKNIERHPWFTQRLPSNIDEFTKRERLPSGPISLESIDSEIVSSLQLLGYGKEEDIKTNLSNPSILECSERIFYHLLAKRKREIFENYSISNPQIWESTEDIDGPRRRGDSFHSISSTSDIYKSSMAIDGRLRPMGPVDEQPIRSADDLLSDKNPSGRRISTNYVTASSNELYTRRNNNESISLHRRVGSGHSIGHRPTGSDDLRKKLTISIPAINEQHNQQTAGSLPVGTPRFHRQHQEFIPPTPTITTSPKRSWFASLFNFKPDVFTIRSQSDFDSSAQTIINILNSLSIKHQPKKDGLKCKVDLNNTEYLEQFSTVNYSNSNGNHLLSPKDIASPSSDNVLITSPISASSNNSGTAPPSLKFKIDIIPEEEGYCKISFVLQVGNSSIFKNVFETVRQKWAELYEGSNNNNLMDIQTE